MFYFTWEISKIWLSHSIVLRLCWFVPSFSTFVLLPPPRYGKNKIWAKNWKNCLINLKLVPIVCATFVLPEYTLSIIFPPFLYAWSWKNKFQGWSWWLMNGLDLYFKIWSEGNLVKAIRLCYVCAGLCWHFFCLCCFLSKVINKTINVGQWASGDMFYLTWKISKIWLSPSIVLRLCWFVPSFLTFVLLPPPRYGKNKILAKNWKNYPIN